MDNPDVVTLKGLNNSIDYSVRQGISYDKDVFSLSSRYKPLQRLSLYAGHEFSQLDHRDIDEWLLLTPQTKIHSIELKAQGRPLDKVKLN